MKLNKNNGFSLIEVLCSLLIFSIIFLTSQDIILNSIKARNINNIYEKNLTYLDGLKNLINSNSSFEEIDTIKNSGKIYIEASNININSLKYVNLQDILTSLPQNKLPYIKFTISGVKVYEINVEYHFNIKGEEKVMKTVIYKGNYI